MAIISGILTAGFGLMQGMYQSQVAENNAKVARWNAQAAIQRSQVEAYDSDMQNRGLEGEIVAAQGASGIDLGSPSAMRVRSTAGKLARQDTLRTRYRGDIEAYNYEVQATNFESQAQASLLGGFAEAIGGISQSLASGASSVSSKWDWMRA